MIPAKTRCPSSEWTLEYKWFVMTAADHFAPDDPIEDRWLKGHMSVLMMMSLLRVYLIRQTAWMKVLLSTL